MNDNNGFIVLSRKMINWGWYQDTNTKTLFIHCLFKANWKDGIFEGITVPRGSFITSISKLSKELSSNKQKFTIQSVRTSLKHLVSTNELTIETTNKFTLIKVNNYDNYQDLNKLLNKQLTNNQQTTNKQLTTIENNKTIKHKNNNISTTTTNVDTDKQSLFEMIEKNFGRTLNAIEIEELSSWDDNELTRYIIKKAILSNVYSIRYISKVLYTYKQKGIRTVVDAEKEYQQFEKERNSKSNKKQFKTSAERTQEVFDRFLASEEK